MAQTQQIHLVKPPICRSLETGVARRSTCGRSARGRATSRAHFQRRASNGLRGRATPPPTPSPTAPWTSAAPSPSPGRRRAAAPTQLHLVLLRQRGWAGNGVRRRRRDVTTTTMCLRPPRHADIAREAAVRGPDHFLTNRNRRAQALEVMCWHAAVREHAAMGVWRVKWPPAPL